jgi:hypothetical protein
VIDASLNSRPDPGKVPLPLSNCPDILTLSEVTIKKTYLTDIFNVSNFAVTVTANDILRIEMKRSSTSVLIDFTYSYTEWMR